MASCFLRKIILTLFLVIPSFLVTNAQLTFIRQFCYNDYGSFSSLTDYEANIQRAITELARRASTSYFSNYSTGLGQDRVNALFSCRYDVSPQVCQSCVASTANNISWCFPIVESLIAYEECTLHYSNRSIFSAMEDLPMLYQHSTETPEEEFSRALESLVTDFIIPNVTTEFFVSSRYFATMTARYYHETIYALAQCTPDITPFACRTCLQTGFHRFTNYTNASFAQLFMPSCRLSYILTREELSRPWRFSQTFRQSLQPSTGTRGSPIMGAIIASIFIVALSLKLLW